MDGLLRREKEELSRSKSKAQTEDLQRKLERFQDTLRRLEERKEKLKILYDSISQSHVVGEDGDPPEPPAPTSVGSQQEAEALKTLDSLRSLADFYRVTGVVVEDVGKDNVQVAFQCHACQTQLPVCRVLLQLSPPAVLGHTLPSFVPVTSLAKQHLSTALPQFVESVSRYVQAFGHRTAAVELLKSVHGDRVEMVVTEPVDHISFTLTLGNQIQTGAQVKLTFSDLLNTTPDLVTIQPRPGFRAFGKATLSTAEKEFRKGNLSEAVSVLASSVPRP